MLLEKQDQKNEILVYLMEDPNNLEREETTTRRTIY
jgi:hypothetical protein